ncbi:MAG: hypothetical protein ACKOC8_12605 [Pirellulales bacterium]
MVILRAPVLLLAVAVSAAGLVRASDIGVMMLPDTGARPVRVRLQWGGGEPQAWSGTIEVIEPAVADAAARRLPCAWRTLSSESDAAAFAHEAAGVIQVHHPRAVAGDGIDLTVADWRTARLVVRLVSREATQRPAVIDVPVADAIASAVQQPLDGLGNRITIRHAPSDAVRVAVATSIGHFSEDAVGLVRRPGDRLRLRVEPLLSARPQAGGVIELRMRLKAARQSEESAEQVTPLVPLDAPGGPAGPTAFEPVIFDVTLPRDDGVYDVELDVVDRGSLRWSRTLASRTVQFAALADEPLPAPETGVWKQVYELDPGSPRLHERLRRLPGVSLPDVPLPSIPRPTLPLPRLPNPLSAASLASVAAMVPRLSGLLAAGDSTVVSHPLGPMLRLPAASSASQPSWEGIVLAAAEPGLPHAVEIDHPLDQEADVGVTVLEVAPGGAGVQARHAGGFGVSRPRFVAAAPRLGTHRFVFWPTTKHPVIVITNPSTRSAAVVGRVRVAVGPARLQVIESAARRLGRAGDGGGKRTTWGLIASPDLAREFGGRGRPIPGTAKAVVDWAAHLDAATHAADLLRSQAAGGALVAAYGGGAATWPSDQTRQAPRWNASDGTLDADHVPRDLLVAAARTFSRAGLGLVPGMSFDAPLPAIEAAIAGGDAAGLGCVGRDGRVRRLPHGGLHYNILDPRVQRAVENLLVEGAGRVRGERAVEGFAILVPHDGWLHLPGVAWGLDDVTFARFAATLPEPLAVIEGDARFAERARLVEGPLRERWLAWRCREVGAFHGRLALALAAIDARWSLHVVPTTLFAIGGLSETFSPTLARDVQEIDVVRIAGFDPAFVPPSAADRLVFVWPQVHATGQGFRDAATAVAANRSASLSRMAGAARRRGLAIIEQPALIVLDEVVPHGPFGSAGLDGDVTVRAVASGGRPLAGPLSVGDVDVVFDARLALGQCAAEASRLGYEAFPAARGEEVGGMPRPLVVRAVRVGGVTWLQVVNASGVAVRAQIAVKGTAAAVLDAVDGSPLPMAGDALHVSLEPWAVRTLVADGPLAIGSARIDHDEAVGREVAAHIERLRARRAVLDAPSPIDVLDNPGFELGTPEAAGRPAATIAGWEVVEPRRGGVALVPGMPQPDSVARAVEFSSFNGLATLRSNPFPAPATGRVSVAVWLRVEEGAAQPPLRIAVEGVQGEREYYRFAAVGGLTGGRPLTGEWSLFVLQVDDLPAEPVESMRVRFDLLGPGRVQIDDVRVFDLAFDESQRVQLTRLLAVLDQQFQAGAIADCLAGLEGYWPTFLDTFVAAPPAVATGEAAPVSGEKPEVAPSGGQRQAGSVMDRVKGWWQ